MKFLIGGGTFSGKGGGGTPGQGRNEEIFTAALFTTVDPPYIYLFLKYIGFWSLYLLGGPFLRPFRLFIISWIYQIS